MAKNLIRDLQMKVEETDTFIATYQEQVAAVHSVVSGSPCSAEEEDKEPCENEDLGEDEGEASPIYVSSGEEHASDVEIGFCDEDVGNLTCPFEKALTTMLKMMTSLVYREGMTNLFLYRWLLLLATKCPWSLHILTS